jgi:hypothetical protein
MALAVASLILQSAPGGSCRGASLIPITFVTNGPTVSGANGTLTYNAGTGAFDASVLEPANDPSFNSLIFTPAGQPLNLVFLDPAMGTVSLTFDLKVNTSGNFVSSGTGVTLKGAVDVDGDGTDDASGTLLTGTIFAFGAGAAGPPTVTFNGLFHVTGGLLTGPITLSGGGTLPIQFPVGATGGFDLFAENVTSGILGNFAASFSSSSVKPSVGLVVPEPGSLMLALFGIVTLGGSRLAQRRRFALSRPR